MHLIRFRKSRIWFNPDHIVAVMPEINLKTGEEKEGVIIHVIDGGHFTLTGIDIEDVILKLTKG